MSFWLASESSFCKLMSFCEISMGFAYKKPTRIKELINIFFHFFPFYSHKKSPSFIETWAT